MILLCFIKFELPKLRGNGHEVPFPWLRIYRRVDYQRETAHYSLIFRAYTEEIINGIMPFQTSSMVHAAMHRNNDCLRHMFISLIYCESLLCGSWKETNNSVSFLRIGNPVFFSSVIYWNWVLYLLPIFRR